MWSLISCLPAYYGEHHTTTPPHHQSTTPSLIPSSSEAIFSVPHKDLYITYSAERSQLCADYPSNCLWQHTTLHRMIHSLCWDYSEYHPLTWNSPTCNICRTPWNDLSLCSKPSTFPRPCGRKNGSKNYWMTWPCFLPSFPTLLCSLHHVWSCPIVFS